MDKVIAPGGKGGFELKIETSRLGVGRQQKYADVSSNDPKQPQFRVFIQGQIDSLFKVDPEQPRIQTVKGVGQGNLSLTLTKAIPAEVKVLGAKSQSGRLLVDLKEVQAGTTYKIDVKTNYGPQDIPITVQVKDRIDLNPRSVYFKRTDFQPLKDKGTPVEKVVEMKAALDAPYAFKVLNTKVEDPDNVFKVKLEPVKDGREYRVVVTIDKLPPLPEDQKVQKSAKGNITLTTDDPLMKEISLRCIAFF